MSTKKSKFHELRDKLEADLQVICGLASLPAEDEKCLSGDYWFGVVSQIRKALALWDMVERGGYDWDKKSKFSYALHLLRLELASMDNVTHTEWESGEWDYQAFLVEYAQKLGYDNRYTWVDTVKLIGYKREYFPYKKRG